MTYTSTYSPEDNKLRLYSGGRLDPETYGRVRAAGFAYAPKQELFYAPSWTPLREDLLLELCGEIDDEDKSLVERAEERSDRFSEYSDSRAEDASQAEKAVDAIAGGIPFGQPILIGHHSERHARKDAERIESGMRRAVKMWDTSKYWMDRAAAALRHAKHKERPDVRARRIKGLEADKRKQDRIIDDSTKFLKVWQRDGLTLDQALWVSNRDRITIYYTKDIYPTSTYEGANSLWSGLDKGLISAEDAAAIAIPHHERVILSATRWVAHYTNRLAYERAMLAQDGGTIADKNTPEKGGGCRCWASPRAGWSYIQKVNKVSVTILDTYGNGGAPFTRTIPFDKLSGVMSAAAVQAKRDAGLLVETSDSIGFGLLTPPTPPPTSDPEVPADPDAALRQLWTSQGVSPERQEEIIASITAAAQPGARVGPFTIGERIESMRDTLKTGVQVVSAPQLFPTPAPLAARMVELADLAPGQHILEPSAGTGVLVEAIHAENLRQGTQSDIIAVEINPTLAHRLAFHSGLSGSRVIQGDFLEQNGNLGMFDRILMNPPFANGDDIMHIKHALSHLNPGGRLVAICANGPRQNAALRPIVETQGGMWQELAPDTFSNAGTNVRTVLLTVNG